MATGDARPRGGDGGARAAAPKWLRVSAQSEERPVPRVFDRGSPVHAYWVRRCGGFTVVDARGRRHGRVRRIERERDELVVGGRLGSRRVAAAAVQSIWPSDGIILVSDEPAGAVEATHAPASTGDETLPWFDLVAAPVVDETKTPPRQAIARPPRVARESISTVIGRVARSSAGAVRRQWRLVTLWSAKRVHTLRRQCARGLLRLAAVVEPRPPDSR